MKVPIFFVVLFALVANEKLAIAQFNSELPYQDLIEILDSANYFVEAHQNDQAAQWLERADIYMADVVSRDIRAKYHLIRANWLLQTWQLRDAENEFLQSINLWNSLTDSLELTSAYNGLGTTLCEQNRFREAIGYQQRALNYFGNADSSRYYGMMANLAVSYNRAQEYDKALSELLKVKNFFMRNNLRDKQAIIENNIGELYREGLQNPTKAIQHYHRAIPLNKAVKQDNYLVQNYHNLGLAFMQSEHLDSAYHYIKSSLQLRKRIDSGGGLAISMHALGKYYLKTNQSDSALAAFQQTLDISEANGIGPGIFYGSTGVGEAYEQLGNYTEAYKAYTRASETAGEIGSLKFQETAEQLLYNFFKKNKRYFEALKHHEQLVAARDSILTLQNQDNLAQARAKYEIELTESENQLLKAVQETQQMQLDRQRWLVIGLLVVLVLVKIAIIVLVWANRQRKKAFRQAVAARKELEVQYQKVKEQEQKLNKTIQIKNRIFSVLGHDLRSPLANISSMLPLISSEELPREETLRILAHLQRDTDLSLNTLHNILQWSQLQTNEVMIRCQHLPVSLFLREWKQVFESSARLKQVKLDFQDQSEGEIWADENQLRSIATNIISNAIKFSPIGEKVSVRVKEAEHGVELSVSDRGSGFDPEVLHSLNHQNKGMSVDGTSGEKGTGIGLQIVRDFVKAHNGKLSIAENETGGTVVIIFFPDSPEGKRRTAHLQSA